MQNATATIRELRLNFSAIKRKVEEYGSVVITDRGVPSFEIVPIENPRPTRKKLPDYYTRLIKQRSKLSPEQARELYQQNRGER